MMWWKKYQVPDLPEGTKGKWSVKRFEVDKPAADLHALQNLFGGFGNRGIEPGVYTKLCRDRDIIMSDTPAEISDHLTFFHKVERLGPSGTRVLIHGLGMGMALDAVLSFKHVAKAVVIEKDDDVIGLVGPHYEEKFGDRVTIQQGDALTWRPSRGEKWDFVWHDIWDNICTDNYEDMKRLHRRFGQRTRIWQGSWSRCLVEMHRDRERRAGW